MNVLFLFRNLKAIATIAALAIGVSACAALPGSNSTTWKEEALLHDGSKIVVERTVQRGGRREPHQQPPIRTQSLTFALPGTQQQVTWNDAFGEEIGTANFLPMLLDIDNGTAYLVVYPMGCLSYNKWGRPNPPYVAFRYQAKA